MSYIIWWIGRRRSISSINGFRFLDKRKIFLCHTPAKFFGILVFTEEIIFSPIKKDSNFPQRVRIDLLFRSKYDSRLFLFYTYKLLKKNVCWFLSQKSYRTLDAMTAVTLKLSLFSAVVLSWIVLISWTFKYLFYDNSERKLKNL